MPDTVDEERRCATEVHQLRILRIVLHPSAERARSAGPRRTSRCRNRLRRRSDRCAPTQVVLEFKHPRRHVEELFCAAARWRGPRPSRAGAPVPWGNAATRNTTIAKVGQHIIDRPGGTTAERALEISVLDESERASARPRMWSRSGPIGRTTQDPPARAVSADR